VKPDEVMRLVNDRSAQVEAVAEETDLTREEAEEVLDIFGVTLEKLISGTVYIGQGQYRSSKQILEHVVEEEKAEKVAGQLRFTPDEVLDSSEVGWP